MKAIRIQIEMAYSVDDQVAKDIYDHDVSFFKGIEDSFYSWEGSKDPRNPINFELRHHMVDHIIEDEEATS